VRRIRYPRRRLPPVRHKVRAHIRHSPKGKKVYVRSYWRGSRERNIVPHRLIRRRPTQINRKVIFPKSFADRERVKRAYSGYGDPYRDVDTGIRDIVRWFNNMGFHTYASCEGHPEDEGQLSSYIAFDIHSPREYDFLRRVADAYFTPYKRQGFTFIPSKKPIWEKRQVDTKYLTYVKKLPDCYIMLEFEWNTRLDKPTRVLLEIIPKKTKSFVPDWSGGKIIEKEIPHVMDFPDLKVTGSYPTQSEWDRIRNTAYEWLANKLLSVMEVRRNE